MEKRYLKMNFDTICDRFSPGDKWYVVWYKFPSYGVVEGWIHYKELKFKRKEGNNYVFSSTLGDIYFNHRYMYNQHSYWFTTRKDAENFIMDEFVGVERLLRLPGGLENRIKKFFPERFIR